MATEQKKGEYRRACDQFGCGEVTLNTHVPLALPFAANFVAGAIAGVSEILTFYPLGEYF